MYLHHSIKFTRGLAGRFQNPQASESTPCFGTPVLPGFSQTEMCNLTGVNGSPWYCGHPLKKELSCSDFKSTRNLNFSYYMPITDAEVTLLNRTCRSPRIRPIPNTFSIVVKQSVSGKTSLSSPTTPCHTINPKLTWHQEEPTGYAMGNKWTSFLCTPTPMSNKCLKNKTLVLLGDSNDRAHYHYYSRFTKCRHKKKALIVKWHAPLSCVHDALNFSIRWDPHSQPFMSHSLVFTRFEDLVSSAFIMDGIPADNHERWIILNHFFHLTTCHTRVIEQKMISLKGAVERLLKRNPNTRVVLQGPHVAWMGWPVHYAAGDSLGQFIMDIQKEVFKDLQDKVFYIYTWDITVATENHDYHPSAAQFFTAIVNGFLCDG